MKQVCCAQKNDSKAQTSGCFNEWNGTRGLGLPPLPQVLNLHSSRHHTAFTPMQRNRPPRARHAFRHPSQAPIHMQLHESVITSTASSPSPPTPSCLGVDALGIRIHLESPLRHGRIPQEFKRHPDQMPLDLV